MAWQDIVNALVGAWLIVAAFLKLSPQVALWNLLISGAIVLILSLWVGSQERK